MTTDNPTSEHVEQAPATHHEPAMAAAPSPLLEEETIDEEEEVLDEAADEIEVEEEAASSEPIEPSAEVPPEGSKLQWYVVKVQSNREETIKAAIERRVNIDGLQEYFGQIVVPTEKVSEMRKGKRYIRSKKLLPGYLMVQVEFNESMQYLFRETSGVGDFVGASGIGKPPQPMSDREIQKWVKPEGPAGAAPQDVKGPAPFNEGDRVKVKDGMFSSMEGVVKQLLEAKGSVVVELTIFGRPVPVELEYWQVDFTE